VITQLLIIVVIEIHLLAQFHDELKDILPDIMMMMKNDKGNKVNVWVAGTNVIVKLARYSK
jgi:hypothetical protein